MFRRYKAWRVEHAQNLEKARAACLAEGIEKGMEQGIAEGKAAVYQEVSAWNARRLAAEAKGVSFNEPPPNGTSPQNG